jgi:magnesium-transporting ATPase (P-type)
MHEGSRRPEGQPSARLADRGGRRLQRHRGITAVLLVNATIGYLQERRAERSLDALRSPNAGSARFWLVRDAPMVKVNVLMIIIGFVLGGRPGRSRAMV